MKYLVLIMDLFISRIFFFYSRQHQELQPVKRYILITNQDK